MPFLPDYPGAIVVEAANYGYGVPNQPRTWGFHTPEEPADSYPSTPDYLASTDRDASYNYFVSYLGFVFQLVPESEGAYAHGLEGKPPPFWSDGTNLNLQTLSVSFEGYASTIHQTMPRGSPQWAAGVNLVAHRTKALGLYLDWSIQHKEVSIYRGDCGQWDQAAFIADVKAKMEEDDMDEATVRRIVGEMLATHSSDKGRFDQIRDNMDGLNRAQVEVVLQLIRKTAPGGGGGYTDAQAVKAVKDALPG